MYFSVFAVMVGLGFYWLGHNRISASGYCHNVRQYFQTAPDWDSNFYDARCKQKNGCPTSKTAAEIAKMRRDNYAIIHGSGCGPTSIAMVLTTLNKRFRTYPKDGKTMYDPISPSMTATFCNNSGDRINDHGTADACVQHAATAWRWTYDTVKTTDVTKIRSLLSRNEPLIAVVGKGPDQKFTSGGHFIVLTGISGDTVYINDPNYNKNGRTVTYKNGSKKTFNTSQENIDGLLNDYISRDVVYYVHK